MPELVQQERLQPSLIDRLVDDEPGVQNEPRERRVLSLQRLREGVLRDLSALLNAGNMGASFDPEEYPDVATSVLNFGMPDLAGLSSSSIDIPRLEILMRNVIMSFEPRIIRKTLRVKAMLNEDLMNHNAISFRIEGELWAQPLPIQLYLKTELDLEVGAINIVEYLGGST